MAKTTATTQTITEDNPSVLSYRVGQLELGVAELKKTVEVGQEKLDKKLTDLMLHFATQKDLAEVKTAAHEEHQRLWDKIDEVEIKTNTIQKSVDDMAKSNISMTLVQKIVFTAVGIALLAIANGVIDKVVQ